MRGQIFHIKHAVEHLVVGTRTSSYFFIESQKNVERHTTHLQQVLPSSAISKLGGSIFQAKIIHKNAGEMNNTI